MLKIAICDDEEKYINDSILALNQIEKNIDEDFYIKSFTGGQSLCDALKSEYFDIILLDIVMKDMSGIEAYKTIQELGKKPLIIYVSNYDDNLKQLFGARIIAFMDKPIDKNELQKNILKAIETIKDDSDNFFHYSKNGSSLYLPYNNIMYFESKRNKVLIHTEKYVEEFNGTISSVWETLKQTGKFVRPHRSYIFNLKYINIKSDTITLIHNKFTYNIGIKYRKDTLIKYAKFVER